MELEECRMTRPLRLQIENAFYHVMNRSIDKIKICSGSSDHERFVDRLAEISSRFDVRILSYCLMSNHYHLLFQTPLTNLSRVMKHLGQVFTRRSNQRLSRDGPLFRGRFKSILIGEEEYLMQVIRYIHLNPVEARIVKSAEEYRWSSYLPILNGVENQYWLRRDLVLRLFGVDRQRASVNYLEFHARGNRKDLSKFYRRKSLPCILGSDEYIWSMESGDLKNSLAPSVPDPNMALRCRMGGVEVR